MRIDILTTFPGMFSGPFDASIVRRSREAGIVDLRVHNLRDYTRDPHRKTDDQQFGGGPGMVMKALPIVEAVEANRIDGGRVVFLSPSGRLLSQQRIIEFAALPQLILVCGHYKGYDERAVALCCGEEWSIGDYVLSGGEIPAMVVVDAVVRWLPGAVHAIDSVYEDAFVQGLLDSPRYTRPQVVRGLAVPEELVSGHHARIAAWRREQALLRTRQRRPDLLQGRECHG